jgi:hypothetical protein
VKTNSSYDYQYFLRDHLGSTRVVFRGIGGQVLERNHYYPYACPPFGVGATVKLQVSSDFRYNSKELESDHNLNWFIS